MQRTNRYNLPEVFDRAIERYNAAYNRGQVNRSVTQLIDSPRVDRLRAKYNAERTSDISEEIFALLGNSVHSLLELGADPNMVVEERLFGELCGWRFSGAIDVQTKNSDGTISISDYKVCRVYAATKNGDEPKREWVQQQNVYAWLVEKNTGRLVRDLTIYAILRDWSNSSAERDPNYPATPILPISLPLWTFEEREEFLKERIMAHQSAEILDAAGYELPNCSPEEFWENGTKFAVKKKGAKRATALVDTEEEAQAVLSTHSGPYYIERREGGRSRCKGNWCQVAEYCTQWQNYKDQIDEPE